MFFLRFVRLQIVSVCAARHVVRACAANKFYNFLSLHRSTRLLYNNLIDETLPSLALANLRLFGCRRHPQTCTKCIRCNTSIIIIQCLALNEEFPIDLRKKVSVATEFIATHYCFKVILFLRS